MTAARMSVRAGVLKGALAAGLLLLGLIPASGAQARTRCSYNGPPQNLLTITANKTTDSREVIRRGQEIVVRENLEPPTACSGGVPTVLNTDTITFRLRGGFPNAYVMLAGGPLAPGATLRERQRSRSSSEVPYGPWSTARLAQMLSSGVPERLTRQGST